MVLAHSDVRRLLLAVGAPLEHHLKGDPEQQQPAGDLERRNADAQQPQKSLARNGEEQQHAERDEDRQRGDPAPLRIAHAEGERQEDRQEADRIDGHEQNDEGAEQGFGGHALHPGFPGHNRRALRPTECVEASLPAKRP